MTPTKSAHSKWAAIAREPEKNFDQIRSAIAAFSGKPEAADHETLLNILQGLARGQALARQAYEWHDASAGRQSKLSKIRGLQWRLVMAVAGLEIMISSLLGKSHPGIHEFMELESRIQVQIGEIRPPKLSPGILGKWIEDESLLRFLAVKGKDLKVLRMFLAGGETDPLDSLAEQLALAKALRNCTAHAALSATKCDQLKLGAAMDELVDVIHRTTEGIFAALYAKANQSTSPR